MTKRILPGVFTAIVAFATVTTSAQTPSSPQTPATPQANTSSAEKRITVTGCLKEAPAATASSAVTPPTGTAGTTGTSTTAGAVGTAGTAAPTFLLINAAPAPAEPSATSPTTDPAPPPAASPTVPQTFRLIANAASLSPHVGKKLELTGTLEPVDAAIRATDPAAVSEPNLATLRVEAGKIVAASCSQ